MRLCVRALLTGLALLGLTPASALAGICFSVAGLSAPAAFDFAPLSASSDGQVPIVGEAYGVCGGGLPPAPIQGSAIVGVPASSVRVGFQVFSNRAGCSGGVADLTLLPPFTSANGVWRVPEGSVANVVLTHDPTGAACQVGTAPATACVDGLSTLCLQQKRFRVIANRTIQAQPVPGQALPFTSESGYFRFASPENIELAIKVLNACALNNRYWVVVTPILSNVEYTLTVTDTQTGLSKSYPGAAGGPSGVVQDTNAFATCP